MCGVFGSIGAGQRGLLGAMARTLAHRGPDGTGTYSSGLLQVGATRLSIVDLGAGPQPVFNETGSVCVVCNGEIYNHRALRDELRRQGHVFRTATDTEVIAHLYEQHGDACIERLDGMFALAILEGERLLLARDRFGIKPLYYARPRGSAAFIFASEIKAILQDARVTPRLNRQALAHRVVLGHSVGAETYFEDVQALLPGHVLSVRATADGIADAAPRPYATRSTARDARWSFDEAVDELGHRLRAAVASHLDADVDVAITLSGGIDSTVLGLLAREHAPHLRTFTIADHPDHPDARLATRIAQRMGSDHHTVILGFDDYVRAIPGMVAAEEQPSTLFALPLLALARTIGRHVKACLHGEGADELFGGYLEYLDPGPRRARYLETLPLLKRLGVAPADRAAETIRRLGGAGTDDDYLGSVFEENLSDQLEQFHLTPLDKLAMAASVEMRVPYLSNGVASLACSLPLDYLVRRDLGVGKYILKRFALREFGPDVTDMVLRQKVGFPASGWQALSQFDRLCEEELPDRYLRNHELGYCFGSKRQLLLFDLFAHMFLEHRGDAGSVPDVRAFIRERAALAAAPAWHGATSGEAA